VASGNVKSDTFSDAIHSDAKKKTKREHFNRWITFNETADRLAQIIMAMIARITAMIMMAT
jgi:hypothetical protein